MASYDGLLPTQSEAIVDTRGIITRKFRDFLAQYAESSNAALQAQIDALAAEVAELVAGNGDLATFVQGIGIAIVGQIHDPTVRVSLNAYLAQLLDVSEAAPADGDALVWNDTLQQWEPGPVLANPMTTEGDIIVADVGGVPSRLPAGADGDVLTIVAGVPAYAPPPSSSNTRGITITGGSIGGSVITAAQVIGGLAASDYTLTGNWYLWCSPSGSIELDVRKSTFGAIPPGPGDTICGGNEPAVVGAISASGNFSGWSTSISRDDAMTVVVNSVASVTWFVLLLEAV